MPSSPRNLKAAAWGWRSAVPSWKRMVDICGPHPTTDEARRFISLCQPRSWKCLRQHDSEFLRSCDSRIQPLALYGVRQFVQDMTLANYDWCATISVSSDVSRDVIREERRRKLRECGAMLRSGTESLVILEATDRCMS